MSGFDLDVSADFKEIESMLSAMPKVAKRIAVRALNKTIKSAEVSAVKYLAKDLGVTQKEARKHVVIVRANWRDLGARIIASGKRYPIIKLRARQVGARKKLRDKRSGKYKMRRTTRLNAGVSYRAMGGKRGFIPGAFIAEMPNGHKGVFKRRGTSRLKIDEKFGASIPHVFVKRASMEMMRNISTQRWRKNFDHEAWFELNKLGMA